MLSFAALAQCFEQLEHTSSRKQLTTLLAELLRQVEADDVGLVVAELAEAAGKAGAGADRFVRDVFAELRAVAGLSGAGSAEGKVAGLTKLLAELDPVSGKHLVRIPLGTSRLGVGDATILAAINQARLSGTKADQLVLEDAYNRTSDLGLLGETLWTKGLEGVKSLDVQVGRPI